MNEPMTCEHDDHPDFKFPVVIDYIGPHDDDPEWAGSYQPEVHALIYTDRSIALTMYECCYATWSLETGSCCGGTLWKRGEWRISEASRLKIQTWRSAAKDAPAG